MDHYPPQEAAREARRIAKSAADPNFRRMLQELAALLEELAKRRAQHA